MKTLISFTLFLVLCWYVTVANAGSEESDSEFAYRIGPFATLGIGAKYLRFMEFKDDGIDSEGIGGPNLALEFGVGTHTLNSGYVLHALEVEAAMPKVAYHFRYFSPRTPESSPGKSFYVGKLGVGVLSTDDIVLSLLGSSTITYVSAAGGIGYQWARHGTIEFTLSYTHSSINVGWLAGGVMLRGVLW